MTEIQSNAARNLLAGKLRRDNIPLPLHSHTKHQPSSSSSDASGTPQPPLEPLPAPQALSLSDIQQHVFTAPHKRIVSSASLQQWKDSPAFNEILGFIMYCNDAVIGKKLDDEVYESPACQALVGILDQVQDVVNATPAEEGSSSRFGNAAFRAFYSKIKEQSRSLHEQIPGLAKITGDPGDSTDAIGEVETYFVECFGNEKRIDYGSGMELNFACWLLCLVKLGVLTLSQEAPALVLRVFWRYVQVMRTIQSTYWLEPAGSHGVWGLDDYHFLPFVFGSAQLKDHKYFKPKSIHDAEILNDFSQEYMYFACIHFINSIKTASLRWHSPMLDDISSVKTWSKVNEGMLKMYKAEVLLKLPIAQHIYFGSLLPYPGAHDDSDITHAVEQGGVVHEDADGHIHVHQGEGASATASGWGDCCGIPIPSAFAAAKEEREKNHGAAGLRFDGGVRRIPFD